MSAGADPEAGRIAGVFGLRGELKLDASRAGSDALKAGIAVEARLADGSHARLTVAALRLHQGRPLVRFFGYDDATAAAALVGARLTVARDDVPLANDEYFSGDLIGCTLVGPDGTALGEVVDVAVYPASDMLVVGARRTLVPMVHAFIRRIDLAARTIAVDLPPGLLDERDAETA